MTTGWRASFAAAPSLLRVNNNEKQGKQPINKARKKKALSINIIRLYASVHPNLPT
jgi:hypothetical protein